MTRITGEYQNIGSLKHFVPYPLPPQNPKFEWNSELIQRYGDAIYALGQLNEISKRLPDFERFIKAYVIKEAMLSSEIEGVNTTIIDMWTEELGVQTASKEVELVANYTKALNFSLKMIKDEGFPIVNRVIKKAHEVLMNAESGHKSNPGNYRTLQVKVGNLVPPASTQISQLMAELENYINNDESLPPLVKTGLAHVQFEAIHPFSDGNGRIGRLLIVLMLINTGLLSVPALYISYYFKKNHLKYYEALDLVRTKGDFEGWVLFFLEAVVVSANDAIKRINYIEQLELQLNEKILKSGVFKKNKENAFRVIKYLFANPVTNVTSAQGFLGMSFNATKKILEDLCAIEILKSYQINEKTKHYNFVEYLELLEMEL